MRKDDNPSVGEQQATNGYLWLNGTADDHTFGILRWAKGKAVFDKDGVGIIPRDYYIPVLVQKSLLADMSTLARAIFSEDANASTKKEALTDFVGKYGLLLYGNSEYHTHQSSWKMTWKQWEAELTYLLELQLNFAHLKFCIDTDPKDSDTLFWCREKMKVSLRRQGIDAPIDISDEEVISYASMQLADLLTMLLKGCPVQVVSYSTLKRIGLKEASDPTKFGFDMRADSLPKVIHRYLATLIVSSEPISICVICGEISDYRKGKKTCGDSCRQALSRSIKNKLGSDENN